MSEPVEIAGYDPAWPRVFAALRDHVTAVLGPLAQRIEHVGSTAKATWAYRGGKLSLPRTALRRIICMEAMHRAYAGLKGG